MVYTLSGNAHLVSISTIFFFNTFIANKTQKAFFIITLLSFTKAANAQKFYSSLMSCSSHLKPSMMPLAVLIVFTTSEKICGIQVCSKIHHVRMLK